MAAAVSVGRYDRRLCLTKLHLNLFLESLFIVLLSSLAHSIEVSRPRGVSLSRASLYDPTKDFTCFDGTATIPFGFVNDDYCDCADGSDEPGTAACPEGRFHCTNAGHKPLNIPSSRVNDGLCDCCDASDEYNSSAECINNCMELGRHAREEQKRQRELLVKGFELRLQMCKEGKEKAAESRTKLDQLKSELEESRKVRDEREARRKEAEDRETEALKKYRDVEDEKKRERDELEMLRHQEEEKANAEEAFNDLDANMDGVLSYEELQKNPIFDQNHDGQVSAEEAKFFLHMKEEMELEEFVSTGWMIMKPIYTMSKVTPIPPLLDATTPMPSPEKAEEELKREEEEEESNIEEKVMREKEESYQQDEEEGSEATRDDADDDDDDEDLEPPEFPPKEKDDGEETPSTPAQDSDPKYDEETQALVDAAKQAREEFNDADQKFRNIENEIRRLEDLLTTDFGPDSEFAALKDQCYEFTDREYTYKLCMFDKASQRPKSGGAETSLGRWGTWDGSEDDRYSRMKYEGGTSCWNGPARSVVVNIHCGLENELTSASEPNRCEYAFDFKTPAACRTQLSSGEQESHHVHEEL